MSLCMYYFIKTGKHYINKDINHFPICLPMSVSQPRTHINDTHLLALSFFCVNVLCTKYNYRGNIYTKEFNIAL